MSPCSSLLPPPSIVPPDQVLDPARVTVPVAVSVPLLIISPAFNAKRRNRETATGDCDVSSPGIDRLRMESVRLSLNESLRP